MFKVAFTQLFMHLQSQNTWAEALLMPHAGQTIKFDLIILSERFNVLENGQLIVSGKTQSPDAIVTITPTTLLRLAAKDEAARSQIDITGDSALATTVAKVLMNMRWDITDDLSKLVGDIPAQSIANLAQKITTEVKETSINATSMITEYLHEEAMVLAKQRHVDAFNASVDTLRSDTARLEKNIAKLEKQLKQPLAAANKPATH